MPAAAPDPTPDADAAIALREQLRTGLRAAMEARETDAVTALRTTIAAIDDAQATPADGDADGRILQAQIDERTEAASDYDTLGQPLAAEQLRREADVLRLYARS